MTNSIQQARLNRLFDMYDPSRDNFMTLEDFTDHAYKLAALHGQSSDSPQAGALVDNLKAWWEQMKSVDTDGDGRISRAEFIAWSEGTTAALRQAADTGAPWPLDPWIEALYQTIDADGDNRITLEEYRNWLTAAGIAHDTNVEAAFKGFDKNQDGYLSREEFSNVNRQWWLEFDENLPGAKLLRPG